MIMTARTCVPRILILAAGLGCVQPAREVVQDETARLPTLPSAPHPAFLYEREGARVYFDTGSVFAHTARQVSDTSIPAGGRQRYEEWPAAARSLFERGEALVPIRDECVAGALMTTSKFAVFDTRRKQWAEAIEWQQYAFRCGALCGEAWHRFRLPGGQVFLDLLMGIS